MKVPKFIRQSAFLHDIIRKTKWGKYRLRKKGIIIKYKAVAEYQNQAPPLILDKELKKSPKVGIVQNGIRFDDYVQKNSSWLFYERYLKNNNIEYTYYDVFRSDWIEKGKSFDIIMWHVNSTPSDLYIAESKIYILEKILGKMCFPSFHEIWQYEDKNRASYLYKSYNLPEIPTFTTNSSMEAMEQIKNFKYPIVSKVNTGAGSTGVEKINKFREARKYVKKTFGIKGRKTLYPYLRQKDYILFQEYIDDAEFDLRVMIIGNKAFGYYRYPTKGDFRASGSGNYEKKAIPIEALKIAIDVKSKLKSRLIGVDLLFSNKRQKYFIIEASLFNQIDTPEQLVIDGVPGYYDISDMNNIIFKPGKFWIHELVMDEIIKEWYKLQTL